MSDRPSRPVGTMLGVQYGPEHENVYEKIREVDGHQFTVAPAAQFHSKSAGGKVSTLIGSKNLNAIAFEPERFDALRERLQVADKRERDANLQAIAVVYAEVLARTFVNVKGLDLAEFERIFYPTYLPTYDNAMRAVGLTRPWWWRRTIFSTLENLSRLPLERCSRERKATMTFEEFYGLLWNYYSPFNANAFLCLILAQSHLINKELVEATAEYLAWRHGLLDESAKKNPILFISGKTGKFAHFLNATKKIPVPVVAVHERPNSNPYLLMIPPEKQAEFKPHPIVRMKTQEALDKYQPSIVLASDWMMNQDETALIRQYGCVREYLYFGISNSYIEGNGWETWGYPKYRTPGETSRLPPYLRDGWSKVSLNHISRWMIHKNDSDFAMGNGSVTTFVRNTLRPTFSDGVRFSLARLRPLF